MVPGISEAIGPEHVDREMWEKVVLNLISNAIKFTWTGRVRIVLERYGGQVVLKVSDTGIGIGLALVKDLVGLHQGTVDVRSERDVGSTFIVKIPLVPGSYGFAYPMEGFPLETSGIA